MNNQLTILAFALAGCHPTAATRVETSEPIAPPPPQIEISEQVPPTEWRITLIEWDDADSGDINGVRFRLSDVDAPETGGVGAAIGGAQCEQERARGIASRSWIQERTRDTNALRITNSYGYDRTRQPRLLIGSLSRWHRYWSSGDRGRPPRALAS